MFAEKKFRINDYLTVKLEGDQTVIYVVGKTFDQCSVLLLNIPFVDIEKFDMIDSIDEIADMLKWDLNNGQRGVQYELSPETEFFGHCSNLQAWYEHSYNTKLLHTNLAFPLLKRLTEAGDPIARRVFKEEIAKRFTSGYPSTIWYLIEENYLNYLNDEERLSLLNDSKLTNQNYSKFLKIFDKSFIEDNNEALSTLFEVIKGSNLAFGILLMILEDDAKFLKNYEIALRLARGLSKTGVSEAMDIFKEEIVKILGKGQLSIVQFLLDVGYLDFLGKERILATHSIFSRNDTKFLKNYELAFKILKELPRTEDSEVKNIFKEELEKRFGYGQPSVVQFLYDEGYLDNLDNEFFYLILSNNIEIKDNFLNSDELFHSIMKNTFKSGILTTTQLSVLISRIILDEDEFYYREGYKGIILKIMNKIFESGSLTDKQRVQEVVAKLLENGHPLVLKYLWNEGYSDFLDDSKLLSILFILREDHNKFYHNWWIILLLLQKLSKTGNISADDKLREIISKIDHISTGLFLITENFLPYLNKQDILLIVKKGEINVSNMRAINNIIQYYSSGFLSVEVVLAMLVPILEDNENLYRTHLPQDKDDIDQLLYELENIFILEDAITALIQLLNLFGKIIHKGMKPRVLRLIKGILKKNSNIVKEMYSKIVQSLPNTIKNLFKILYLELISDNKDLLQFEILKVIEVCNSIEIGFLKREGLFQKLDKENVSNHIKQYPLSKKKIFKFLPKNLFDSDLIVDFEEFRKKYPPKPKYKKKKIFVCPNCKSPTSIESKSCTICGFRIDHT